VVRATRAPRGVTALYPVIGLLGVAASLGLVWWGDRGADPGATRAVYPTTLLAVAAGYPFASWAIGRDRRRVADQVLQEQPVALERLTDLLSHALGDAPLSITLADHIHVASGSNPPAPRGHRVVTVTDGNLVLGWVQSDASALDDERTAEAVAQTVRLFLTNQRLRELQDRQVAELGASRTRLVAAADRERERMAQRLAHDVADRLTRAQQTLREIPASTSVDVAQLVTLVEQELSGSAAEVGRLAAGAAPPLGDGLLATALQDMASRLPLHVSLTVAPSVSASSAVEVALFYTAAEALTNATKHAAGSPVEVDVRVSGDDVVLTVRDHGPGGADPDGSGLQGLADRVAAAGGHLWVDSAAGAGTTVSARLPR